MFSQSYNVPVESLIGSSESNNYMDKVTETYGPKPSPKQVAGMAISIGASRIKREESKIKNKHKQALFRYLLSF